MVNLFNNQNQPPPRSNKFITRLTTWLDPHLLLLWLFTVPAITPLLQPTITHSADGLLHLYRLVALEQTLQQGAFFPRWLPDLAYGYGFPLFVFYAPLSYYLTLALSSVGDLVTAFNASFSLALLLSGTGAYLLVKDNFGARAGLLAGIAYAYAPFQLFNAFSRGGLPAAWAMAIFPFAFWSFGRLLWPTSPTRFSIWLPISAIIFGLALLTHNTLTLLFAPLLAIYLAVGILSRFISKERAAHLIWRQTVLPVGLTATLGVGLAAFFLLPALIEKEFAQVHRVITSPDFDFRFNFVTLGDLFSLPPAANTGLLNPKFPLTLGLAQLLLAMIGLGSLVLSIVISRPQSRLPQFIARSTVTLFATATLVAAIFMMLPQSLPLWERLPLIEFIQFPHRLLGPAALMLAILAGAAIATLPDRVSFWLTLVGIVLIFLNAVPLLYPRYNITLPNPPTLVDMMAYEQRSGVIGTTSFGEYLPIWVENIPRESPLEPMYQTNIPVERLDATYLPSGAKIEASWYEFNHLEIVVDSPEPFPAIFHTFYFPGWVANVNGQSASISPFSQHGLLKIDVPAGRHELSLSFQETPIRRVSNWLSLGTMIIISGLFISTVIRQLPAVDKNTMADKLHLMPTKFQLMSLVMVALILIGLKTLYFDSFDTPLKRTFDGTVAGGDVTRQVNFGNQINLIGYDLPASSISPGESFDLTAYWQAQHPLITAYSALAQVVDAEQHLYAGQDNLHPGGVPAIDWLPWGFIQDPHHVVVPFGTPPGDYFLTTGLYDPTTGQRLPVLTGGDSDWVDVIAIPVTIEQPNRQPTLAELNITWPQNIDLTPELRLLGATPERETIVRNDFLRLALFWEATAKPNSNYEIAIRLVDEQEVVILEQTGQPSHNRYPTHHWSPGEFIRDNHALWIAADFPVGQYRLQVQVVGEAGQPVSRWVDVGGVG